MDEIGTLGKRFDNLAPGRYPGSQVGVTAGAPNA